MSGSVNKVIIIGNLGRDPEVRSFPNGGKVCNLRIATSETWRDKQTGERREKTEWHAVSITNEGIAKIAEQYLRKGSTVYIEGQLETRKWQDQQGNDRYSTEVVVKPFSGSLTLLGGNQSGERGQSGGGYDQSPAGYGGNHSQGGYGGGSAYGAGTGGAGGVDEDEIPF